MRSKLHPESVSHFETNCTIREILDVIKSVQSQDADFRIRILLAFVFVFVLVVARFWNYLINRRLRGACWLLATGFYAQFSSLALATAPFISIANLVVCSLIFSAVLRLSCNLRHTLNVFVKIISISSLFIHTQLLQPNFSFNSRYSIGYITSSSAFPSSVVLTDVQFHAK